MSDCRFRLDANLADAFVQALERTLRRAGYERVFEFSGPEGPGIVQFQQGQSVVAIDQKWEGEEHRWVSIEAEDLDCQELARQAAVVCIAEIAADLFSPLLGRAHRELRTKAEQVLTQFAAQLLEGGS